MDDVKVLGNSESFPEKWIEFARVPKDKICLSMSFYISPRKNTRGIKGGLNVAPAFILCWKTRHFTGYKLLCMQRGNPSSLLNLHESEGAMFFHEAPLAFILFFLVAAILFFCFLSYFYLWMCCRKRYRRKEQKRKESLEKKANEERFNDLTKSDICDEESAKGNAELHPVVEHKHKETAELLWWQETLFGNVEQWSMENLILRPAWFKILYRSKIMPFSAELYKISRYYVIFTVKCW